MEVIIVEANNLSLTTFRRQPRAFVEIAAGDVRLCRTESIKQKKDGCTRWDATFVLPTLGGSSKMAFSVFHDGIVRDKCLGRLEIDVRDLLNRQRQQAEADVVLALLDAKGQPSTGRLAIRVAEQSTSAIATAVEQARISEQKLLPPQPAKTSDAITSVANTVSNQQDLATSFGSLLDKVAILVKVGDEVAKIHPYVNFAWQVLSVGLKMVNAQQSLDQKISDLVTTMEDTYTLVLSAQKLKENDVLQDIVGQILKQTIECGFFIQEYTRHSFGARAIRRPFSGADDIVTKFCAEFTRLRSNFDSGVNLSTVLVLSRTELTIERIRRDQVLSHLKSVDINEYDRSPCLPKTRSDVIKSITEWIADQSDDQKRVLWLYGLAGSGKSTLSTTIARTMRDLRRLGAFFYFDRDIPERNATTLIRTLAYQLALFDAQIGVQVSQIVEDHPNIAGMPLDFQFANLLTAKALGSVKWSGGPIVLVIDALDECGSEKDRAILMQALSKGFSDLPPFMRVVVVSRQEADIEDTLASHLAVHPYYLGIDSVTNKEDISEFLRHRFSEIRKKKKYLPLGSDWPGDDNIDALTKCAAGLFVWASTACLYIDSHDPRLRLNELITQQLVDTSSAPFANLDGLYKTGLQSAGSWADPLFCSDCNNIFGVVLCARIPVSCSMIDSLLALPRPCLQSISHLGCVFRWSETEPVRILHPSFHDYLSKRCRTEAWSIDVEHHNEKLAIHCIELLDNTLQENMCGLTLPYPVQKETLPDAMSYACKFWVEHICLISHSADNIGDKIYRFMGQHLLHWMEALAILKSHGTTIQSLQKLLVWFEVCHSKQSL